MSHPSQTPNPDPREQAAAGQQHAQQFTGYGYGGQPIDPRTGWPYPPHAAGRPQRKSPGLGIASLILGIVGIMLAWIPLIGYFALVLGMVGAVLGFVGIFKSHRALSIAGTALSVTAMAFSIVAFVSLADALDDAANDYNTAVAAPSTEYTPSPAYTPPPLPTPSSDSDEDVSVSQSNATEKAESYLSWTHFSRSGLIDQLEFEGFTATEATQAVDSLDIDWNEQAAGSAESYMSSSSFSRAGLIDQLEFEGFTTAQAQHGADSVGL